jgi:enoyl-CoA hydratase/carnithine racemase
MDDRVSISISAGIADVRLVRADKMNALDAAMFDALVAASGRLAREKGVRAVVLSGEGRSFCAGLDMGRFAAMKEGGGNGIAGGEKRDLTARTHGLANFPQQAVWGWRQLPVPVIAAGRGVRRRLSARAWRRHAVSRARCADVDHGNQMGADT